MRNGTALKIGDKVKRGDSIAVMGNTGDCSSSNPNIPKIYAGTHLHFEIWVNNEPADPEPYLRGTKNIGGSISSVAAPASSSASAANTTQSTAAFKIGDKVKVKGGVLKEWYPTFDGKSFRMWHSSYTVIQIRRDGAVVIGVDSVVTAAVKPEILTKI